MIVLPASYSFPTVDSTVPRFQDFTMGARDLIRSRTGWDVDPNPIFGPGLPDTMLRDDHGHLLYGAGGYGQGNTYDDEPIVVLGPFAQPGVNQGLASDGGVLMLTNSAVGIWPGSPAGLGSNALWNDGLVVAVANYAPSVSAAPLLLSRVSDVLLLGMGAALISDTVPAQSGYIYVQKDANDSSGILCVS